MGETIAYAVWSRDYDWQRVVGRFPTREEAEEYAARLRRCEAPNGADIAIEEEQFTPDQRALPGCYVVELNEYGDVVEEGWQSWCGPDNTWGNGLSAHWWTSDGERTTVRSTGAVLRAVGWDREEALARGQALLCFDRAPTQEDKERGDGE